MLDARRGDPLDVVKTAWLADEFFPEVATRLAPYPLRLVVFSSPARIEQMRTDAVVVSPVIHALTLKRPYQACGVFTDESAGVWASCWINLPSTTLRGFFAGIRATGSRREYPQKSPIPCKPLQGTGPADISGAGGSAYQRRVSLIPAGSGGCSARPSTHQPTSMPKAPPCSTWLTQRRAMRPL